MFCFISIDDRLIYDEKDASAYRARSTYLITCFDGRLSYVRGDEIGREVSTND